MAKKRTIGITCDIKDDYKNSGLSIEELAELDKKETIDAIQTSIQNLGHTPKYIGNIHSLNKLLANGEKWDLVFNISEGLYGSIRESQIPALLDAYKIEYTFSDALTLAICLNKGLTKKVLKYSKINTPDFFEIDNLNQLNEINHFPLFAKPIAEGTSKGVELCSLINNKTELKNTTQKLLEKFNQSVLIEEYLPGKEFTIGIVGTGENAKIIGVIEINCHKGLYTFESKQNYQELVKYQLAEEPYKTECSEFALNIWRTLKCRDAGRIDVKYDKNNKPSCIEINPLAGLHPIDSDLPIMCNLQNIPYQKLIEEILESAIKRLKF